MEDTDNGHNSESYSFPQYHIPICDEILKPSIGRYFETFDVAVEFYKTYAKECGFDVRMGTIQKSLSDGSIVRQYVYCNREGHKNVVPDDVSTSTSKLKRRRVSNRVGCMARISFKFSGLKGCVVERFEEGHTHPLVSIEFRRYMKVNRNLGYVEKNFIMNCARANIGATKSYRFYKEFVGDYSEVGSVANDWRNYARDLKAYIIGCDAQLILNKMALKKKVSPDFFYDYSVNENDELSCVFWADPVARRNCSVFGDVVSFDCTYGTNRYKMIFAPFTGKDNHGKIVTFGAALLSRENINMYSWVFAKYKECMGRSPILLITDQDPALKVAVERELPDSMHRLCMWHIMMKVPEKTPSHLKKDEDFRKRLNAIVWSNQLIVSEFEQQWNELMEDFDLSADSWFNGLYEIRHLWIPAYFRDIPLSGICRTTSISESVNSFFGNYLSQGSNLVEFLMHFESALDAQRQTNDMLNSLDKSSVAQLKTPMPVEKHAASIYTNSIFLLVQEEIELACFTYGVISTEQCDARVVYTVSDASYESLPVTYDKDEDTIVCSCNKFMRDGILCSHIFLLFKSFKWSVIPDKYVVCRWTRAAYANPLPGSVELSMIQGLRIDDNKKMINKMTADFYACVGVVQGNMEKTKSLMDRIAELRVDYVDGDAESSLSNKRSNLFENFYGIERTDEINVHPPQPVKTKGSGSRIKSRIEAAVKRANKPKRMCSKCKKLSDHDARNCKA